MPKYPKIKVKLVGEDGNAFFILGRCLEAMRRAGLSKEEQEAFQKKLPLAITTISSPLVWSGLM